MAVISTVFEELSNQSGPERFLFPLPISVASYSTDIVNSFAIDSFTHSFGFTTDGPENTMDSIGEEELQYSKPKRSRIENLIVKNNREI